MIKIYQIDSFASAQICTEYLGQTIKLNFKASSGVDGRYFARLLTKSQFVQDAIENDERFKDGSIKIAEEYYTDAQASAAMAYDKNFNIGKPESALFQEVQEVVEPIPDAVPMRTASSRRKKKAEQKAEEEAQTSKLEFDNTNDAIAYLTAQGKVVNDETELSAMLAEIGAKIKEE